jgi:hypothetical protein
MRHTEIRAIYLHALSVPQEAGDKTRGKSKYLLLKLCAVERDTPVHKCEYSKYAILRPVGRIR